VVMPSHCFSSASAAGDSTGGVTIVRFMAVSVVTGEKTGAPAFLDQLWMSGAKARARSGRRGAAARSKWHQVEIFSNLIASLSSTWPPIRFTA
jgi:hypothetical protein